MYRSIFTALKPSFTQTYIVGYSVALARRLNSELNACIVMDVNQVAPRETVPIGAGAFKKSRDEELTAAARVAAEDALTRTLAAGATAGIRVNAELVEGDVVDVLTRRSHEHDLLIVGHSPGDRGDESLLNQILRTTSRPAIVLPERSTTGSSVVVGYDGSRQASRALSSFVASGLGIYRMIHVVSCHADRAEAKATCEVACRFLVRHGLEAIAHPEEFDQSPETMLLDWIGRCDAGLLVIGAFGHSSIHDLLFGSTAGTIIRDLPLPVLLDH
jgi:nucleotide-binding universal stress UspA family protein